MNLSMKALLALIFSWCAPTFASIENLDTCFAPNEACDKKLIEFISTAETTIDIAIFNLTLRSFTQAVTTLAAKPGMQIRIVIDHEMSQDKLSVFQDLKNRGVQIKYGSAKGIMHNKFTIIDGKKIETGSFNYTSAASKMNAENQIYLFDEKPVKAYKQEFEDLWASGVAF